MHKYSRRKACFEHSNFFKVNLTAHRNTRLRAPNAPTGSDTSQDRAVTPNGEPPHPDRDPTTSFLTATTLIYAIGAGITAAAGTRLALQWFLVKGFKIYSFQLRASIESGIVIFRHYLPGRQWVIYAPAAFLRSGSRFSGSLSGIEP